MPYLVKIPNDGVIFDDKGNIFYVNEKDARVMVFPNFVQFSDTYPSVKVDYSFNLIKKFLKKYKPKRKFNPFKTSRIIPTNTRIDKLCTYPAFNTIIINKSFFNSMNRCQKFVTTAHEKAHCFYKDETLCDLFAVCMALCYGFPRDMIYDALRNSLSVTGENVKRISRALQFLINTKSNKI